MNRLPHLIGATVLASALSVSAQALEYFTFDADSNGEGMATWDNTGSLNSEWRFDTVAQGDVTNGTGQLVIAGDSGTFTRKLPERGTANALPTTDFYSDPITTGQYRLDLDFASWNIDAASANGADLDATTPGTGTGDTWSFGVNDSGNNRLARLSFQVVDINDQVGVTDYRARIQYSNFDGNFRTVDYNLVETGPISAAIVFDFDANTIAYLDNTDTEIASFGFTGADIGQFIYSKGGVWGTSASSLTVEEFGLTAVPEPGTYALIAGLLALSSMAIRRRK